MAQLDDKDVFRTWFQPLVGAEEKQLTPADIDLLVDDEWNRIGNLGNLIATLVRSIWAAERVLEKVDAELAYKVDTLLTGRLASSRQRLIYISDALTRRGNTIQVVLRAVQELRQVNLEQFKDQLVIYEALRKYEGKRGTHYALAVIANTDLTKDVATLRRVQGIPPLEEVQKLAAQITKTMKNSIANDVAEPQSRRTSEPQPDGPLNPMRKDKRKRTRRDADSNGNAESPRASNNPQPPKRPRQRSKQPTAPPPARAGGADVGGRQLRSRTRQDARQPARRGAVLSPLPDYEESAGDRVHGLPALTAHPQRPPPLPPILLGGRQVFVDWRDMDFFYREIMDRLHLEDDVYALVQGELPSDFVKYCVNCMFDEHGRSVHNVEGVCQLLLGLMNDELPPDFPWDLERKVDPDRDTLADVEFFGPYQRYLMNLVSQPERASENFIEYVRSNLDVSPGARIPNANKIASRILSLYFEHGRYHEWSNEANVSLDIPSNEALGLRPGFDGERNSIGVEGRWSFLKQVGKGGNGRAVLYVKYDDGNRIISRTVVKEAFLDFRFTSSNQWWQDIRGKNQVPKEAGFHGQLPEHRSIVRYLGYGIYSQLRMVRLYTEYCSLGDGFAVFDQHRRLPTALQNQHGGPAYSTLPAVAIWAWFETAAAALCLMQHGRVPSDTDTVDTFQPAPDWDHDFVHRDIKLANFFLEKAPAESALYSDIPVFKLGDFGAAVDCKRTTDKYALCGCGTPGIEPPEQRAEDMNKHKWKPCAASNVWQVGYAMLTLMALRSPSADVQPQMSSPIIPLAPEPLERFNAYPEELKSCVLQCLSPIPPKRVSSVKLYLDVRDAVKAYPDGDFTVPLEFQRVPGGKEIRAGEERHWIIGLAK